MTKYFKLFLLFSFFNVFSMEKSYTLRDDSIVKINPFKVQKILFEIKNHDTFLKFFNICSEVPDNLSGVEIAILNMLGRKYDCVLFDNGQIVSEVANIVKIMVKFDENNEYYFIDPIKPDCVIL